MNYYNVIYCKDLTYAKFLIGLLDSKFQIDSCRITSTNNNVNLYELELPPISNVDSTNHLILKIIKIDELVYKLYNLNDEEIKVID